MYVYMYMPLGTDFVRLELNQIYSVFPNFELFLNLENYQCRYLKIFVDLIF